MHIAVRIWKQWSYKDWRKKQKTLKIFVFFFVLCSLRVLGFPAMAISARLPQFLSTRTKKTNLYYVAATTVLCSVFYLAGILQHGGFSSRQISAAALLPTVPCDPLKKDSIGTSNSTPSLSSSSSVASLDFAAHHAAEELVPLSQAPPAKAFPPCKLELSEYTPCQDTERSLKFDRRMLKYRERHCPEKNELLKCRIPAPFGYKIPVRWPESRDSVWYANVPHKHLTVEKAGQNWVRFKGERFTFPGGGTMFPRGADAYIDDIGHLINLKDGSIRTAIDTGCGVSLFTNHTHSNFLYQICLIFIN